MTDRIHRFEALENFRDYGDYATSAGRLARGRLFRSAHQARASQADLNRLADLGILTIVDLRRPGERQEQPSRRPPGWSGAVIESSHEDGAEAPHIAFLKRAELTVDSARKFMEGVYRGLAFEPPHLDLFARYFRVLGETDGPVLIHCAAGKDRTGLLAALTHHLAGLDPEDIIADYLLTNQAVDLKDRAPGIAKQLEAMTGRSASPEAVVAFLGVEAAWLEMAFTEIREQYGSIDAYFAKALGVDSALRDQICERISA